MSGDHNMYASGSGDGQRSGWRKRQILDMAREAGMVYRQFEDEFANANTDAVDLKTLEAFAKLVCADEREACAKVAEEWLGPTKDRELHIAAAIRTRGQTSCTHEWVDDTKDKPTWRCANCNCEYTKGQS
jgi:hypothetical protein